MSYKITRRIMATTKQTYEIIKVLSELSKQGPFSMKQGLGSLKDVIKINSPFASKKAKEIWKNSDKNLELLFTVSGSSTKGYTTTDVQKLLGLKVEEKKKAPSIKPFISKKAKTLADENNLSKEDFPQMEKVSLKDVKEKLGIVDQKKKAPSDLFASKKAREFAQTNDLDSHEHFKTATGTSKDGKFSLLDVKKFVDSLQDSSSSEDEDEDDE